MKRLLLIAAAALMLLSTLVIPDVVHADGGGNGTGCPGNTLCKP